LYLSRIVSPPRSEPPGITRLHLTRQNCISGQCGSSKSNNGEPTRPFFQDNPENKISCYEDCYLDDDFSTTSDKPDSDKQRSNDHSNQQSFKGRPLHECHDTEARRRHRMPCCDLGCSK